MNNEERDAERMGILSQHAHNTVPLAKMAVQAHLSLEEFKARYGYLAGIAPQPF